MCELFCLLDGVLADTLILIILITSDLSSSLPLLVLCTWGQGSLLGCLVHSASYLGVLPILDQLCMWCEILVQLHSLAYEYLIVSMFQLFFYLIFFIFCVFAPACPYGQQMHADS